VISSAYCQLMARYSTWMNERLYAVCAGISADDRVLDRGAFFGSIHGTLNHLLWGDRMWLGRFTGSACNYPPFGADMFGTFEELAHERQLTDTAMLQWAANVSGEWLESTIEYVSKVDNKARCLPASVAAVHLFNHRTHHRGQLTTLMKQAGADPGPTDLP
jgi:uncharacterized damage-inducible protein DinB